MAHPEEKFKDRTAEPSDDEVFIMSLEKCFLLLSAKILNIFADFGQNIGKFRSVVGL